MPLYNIVITKDSEEPELTNNCCPFAFGSVMGQEDLYREDPPGNRVSNTLTARIVWATTVPATSRVIWDLAESGSFSNDTGIVASNTRFHEVFFPVPQVSTIYKFQVISTSTECNPSGETLQSGTFYFEVGGEIISGESVITHVFTLTPTSLLGLSINSDSVLLGEFEDLEVPGESSGQFDQTLSSGVAAIDYSDASNIGISKLYTNYSTSVT